jgi:diacylglycerol kinase (ATP)
MLVYKLVIDGSYQMKPKYSLKNNFLYAVDGFKVLLKENAFRIEMVFFVICSVVLFFLPFPLWGKTFMFASLFLPLLAEAFNTSIEKVVDLISDDFHILAKYAKDIAAFGVLLSIFLTFFIWLGFILFFTS